MLIGNDYKIESDGLNVTVSARKVRTNRKTGENYEGWSIIGYYGNVQNALNGLIDYGVAETELKDLKTVVDKINELKGLLDPLPKAFSGI